MLDDFVILIWMNVIGYGKHKNEYWNNFKCSVEMNVVKFKEWKFFQIDFLLSTGALALPISAKNWVYCLNSFKYCNIYSSMELEIILNGVH